MKQSQCMYACVIWFVSLDTCTVDYSHSRCFPFHNLLTTLSYSDSCSAAPVAQSSLKYHEWLDSLKLLKVLVHFQSYSQFTSSSCAILFFQGLRNVIDENEMFMIKLLITNGKFLLVTWTWGMYAWQFICKNVKAQASTKCKWRLSWLHNLNLQMHKT